MPVIAANVPRFLAAHVAKNNASTEGIAEQYLQWLPKHTYAPEGAYKGKILCADELPGSSDEAAASAFSSSLCGAMPEG